MMNANNMGAEIIAAIDAVVRDHKRATADQRLRVWIAISGAIINHIQQNAEVAVESVTNVQTGSDTSGPGTGTVS